MSIRDLVIINDKILPISRIYEVNFSEVHTETVVVTLVDGTIEIVTGFAAVELVWLLKPSALEGNNKIKWRKNAWAIHNIFGHPIMQVLAWFGKYKTAIRIHDETIPKPIGIKTN